MSLHKSRMQVNAEACLCDWKVVEIVTLMTAQNQQIIFCGVKLGYPNRPPLLCSSFGLLHFAEGKEVEKGGMRMAMGGRE